MAIKIEELTKDYRTGFWGKKIRAINNIDFIVEPGKIFGFLGPNGAGKTTTIKILTGLIYPSSGRASVLDKKVPDVSIMRRVGYLPEHPSFYIHLTGFELLVFYARIFGIHPGDQRKRAKDLIERVGLDQASGLRISKYSKGMVQRLGIAQALINDPDLLIFDEPMEGLDPIGRKDVKEIMLELKKKGKTVFFSTHILPDVEAVCDRVSILLNGRLISIGSLEELLKETVESLELTIRGLNEDAISIIGANAVKINRSDINTQFIFDDVEVCDEIIDLVRKHGGKIISIVPRVKTLEEYFMTKVKQDK